MSTVSGSLSMSAGASMSGTARRTALGSGRLAGAGNPVADPTAVSLSAAAVLTCSYLSARITMATATMFPGNQRGTYGAVEDETSVTVPGVTDGIYT
jgi:hypothetical protein